MCAEVLRLRTEERRVGRLQGGIFMKVAFSLPNSQFPSGFASSFCSAKRRKGVRGGERKKELDKDQLFCFSHPFSPNLTPLGGKSEDELRGELDLPEELILLCDKCRSTGRDLAIKAG